MLHIRLIKNEVQFIFTYFESKRCRLHFKGMIQMLEQVEGLSCVINLGMYFIPNHSPHPQYSQFINWIWVCRPINHLNEVFSVIYLHSAFFIKECFLNEILEKAVMIQNWSNNWLTATQELQIFTQ